MAKKEGRRAQLVDTSLSQLPAIVVLVLGGVLLYFGAEWLVRGSSGLAAKLRIQPVIIGLTVVAYGTSAPELIVSVGAALTAKGDLAFGNVVGSNIANLGLILGAAIVISPSPPLVEGSFRQREVPALIVSSFLLPILLLDGRISRLEGVLLVALALIYTLLMLRHALATKDAKNEVRELREVSEVATDAAIASGSGVTPQASSAIKLIAFSVFGLGFLLLGGKWLVDGASRIAVAFGLSERLIGLTIVSVGTSLPELATSIIAARRGHAGIAIGNVIGSNIFNALLILGASAVTAPLPIGLRESSVEISTLVAITLLGAFFLRGARHLSRTEGGILLTMYALFLTATILR